MKDSPIVKEMGTKGIQTHVTFWNHHWQLVIPNVNDARIGRKLRELNPC